MSDDTFDQLGAHMGRFLASLLTEHAFELPVHFVMIGRDGSIMGGTYAMNEHGGGLDADVTVSHAPSGVLTLPVNIVFVDSRGAAARVLIGPEQTDAKLTALALSEWLRARTLVRPFAACEAHRHGYRVTMTRDDFRWSDGLAEQLSVRANERRIVFVRSRSSLLDTDESGRTIG